MAVKIIEKPPQAYTACCTRCQTKFTYELGDLTKNYKMGGESVSCPTCSEPFRHRPGGLL